MSCNVAEHESAQAGLAQLRTGRFWRGAEVDRDLLEWNYGNYEGRTSVDIHAERPDCCYSGTAVLEGKCPPRSRPGPIAWSPAPGPHPGRAGVLERAFRSLNGRLESTLSGHTGPQPWTPQLVKGFGRRPIATVEARRRGRRPKASQGGNRW
jgi:hypothetical protein